MTPTQLSKGQRRPHLLAKLLQIPKAETRLPGAFGHVPVPLCSGDSV